jgi:hypothetical protein
MEIILHIGTDKTGSTSIQRSLYANREWFGTHGIFIPSTGLGVNNGHAKLLGKLNRNRLQELALELNSAAGDGYRTAVLSWEGMSSYGRKEIGRLAGFLREHEKRLLVYLREQADIIQSGQLQRTKANRNRIRLRAIERHRGVREFLESWMVRNNPRRNYYRLLRRWEKSVPGLRFSVRIFDKGLLAGGDVVVDFVRQLGVTPDAQFFQVELEQNPSLDVESALLVEAYQQKDRSDQVIKQIVEITQSIVREHGSGNRYFLARDTVGSIRKHFAKSNLKLARHFMNCDQEPFPNRKDCWRERDFESLESGSRAMDALVSQIREIPVLKPAALRQGIPGRVSLDEGWYESESGGVYSSTSSRLRFRVPFRKISLGCSAISIIIRGRYCRENRSSKVTINGVNFGEKELVHGGDCDLLLPASDLYPYEVVEVVLEHADPASPEGYQGKKDPRQFAFELVRVGFRWVA